MSVEPEKYGEDPNPLSPRARGSQAACSDEVWAQRTPNPRDVKYERIVERIYHQDELNNPERGSVRYAWLSYKNASRELHKALKHWLAILPCKFWWHAMRPTVEQSTGVKVCRRCGAWRE